MNLNSEIWAAAPETEPERQYYFIEVCKRSRWQEESERLGRPLTFCVTTFGCQMNARDSEKLTGILEADRISACRGGRGRFRDLQYLYRPGKRQPEGIRPSGSLKAPEKRRILI